MLQSKEIAGRQHSPRKSVHLCPKEDRSEEGRLSICNRYWWEPTNITVALECRVRLCSEGSHAVGQNEGVGIRLCLGIFEDLCLSFYMRGCPRLCNGLCHVRWEALLKAPILRMTLHGGQLPNIVFKNWLRSWILGERGVSWLCFVQSTFEILYPVLNTS